MRVVCKLLTTLIYSVILAGPVGVAVAAPAGTEPEALRKVRLLQAAGKLPEAIETLSAALKSENSAEKRAILFFARGGLHERTGSVSAARDDFSHALESGTRLDDYARFSLGKAQLKLGEVKAARKNFEAVLDSKATQQMQFEARQQLAEIAIKEKTWIEARRHLTYLQKKRKFTESYPEILFHLIRVDRGMKNFNAVCRWSKELFSKYPAHPLVASWTMDISKARVDGQPINCTVTVKDKQDRIRRLQWAGEDARSLAELKALQAEAPYLGEYTFDTLMSNHLMNEGATEEALELLVKHYESHSGDPTYLMQLGKAASRAGEYQAAVGAFYKAYRVAPGGRSGKQALFQAAFMSYQSQDYDGATRKFQEFIEKYPRSGLSRDSGWHLAWVRYLKGDYRGAHASFAKLKEPTYRKRRGRRIRIASANLERAQYWSAMSLLKLGRTAEAKPIFEAIARDPGLGFYSLVSFYRLQALGEKPAPKPTETRTITSADASPDLAAVEGKLVASEEEESEEAIEGEEAAAAPGETAEGEGEPIVEERLLNARFNDPYLSRRFDRARELVSVGRTDLARQELYAIERGTRSSEDRRKLMTEYQTVENFNRASYISEIGFGAERRRGGLQGARPLWEFAYPRAFERTVVSSSRTFGVPTELIWGIMRAESQFRQDVQSPVGAMGLMQLMPFTGRKVADLLGVKTFEVKSLLEPETNIRMGTRYLQRLSDKFSGSVPLTAAAYNAGPHRVQSWLKSFGLLDMDEFIEHIPFIETRNYVKKVVRNYQVYNMLYNGSSKQGRTLNWLVKPVGVKTSDPGRDVW